MFSVFDPMVNGFSINFIVIVFLFMLFMSAYYSEEGMLFFYVNLFKMKVMEMLGDIVNSNMMFIIYFSFSLFITIVVMNLVGMFPFIFSFTAHPYMTMSLGMVLWLGCVMMGMMCNFSNSIAHLTPQGCPMLMAPLLVMIETISHIIRPFTLSVRLAANMMAGHLIMGLLSKISVIFSYFCLSVIMQNVLLLLELSVCVIQGVVFSILFMLYVMEYY